MKLHILNKVLGVGIAALLLTACTDGNDWSTDASKARMFSIASSDIAAGRYMTKLGFLFKAVKGAEAYTLEVSRDTLTDEIAENANGTSILLNLTPTQIKDTVWVENLKKDTRYYVRIRTTAQGKTPSKWSYYKDSKNRYYVKTKAEQLFSTAKSFAQTVIRPTDLFQDSLRLRWKKDDGSETAAVDHIVVSNGSQQVANITLTDEQKTKRVCVIKYTDYSLAANTAYNFKLYNGEDKRGELNVTTPKALPAGIHILDTDAGETVEALISAATADIVIGIPATSADVEDPADDALSVGAITLPEGVSVTLIGLQGGKPRCLNFSKAINIGGSHALLRFENLQLANGGSNYLINQKGACTVDEISFQNVTCDGFSNSFIRLQSGVSEEMTIKKITIVNCLMGNQKGGAFIYNNNAATNYIDEIVITNSTFYNLEHSFINVAKSRPSQITINDVTFYNIIASDRYFVDANGVATTFDINRCIFAKTNNKNAKGIRNTETEKEDYITYTFGNCYMTSDFTFKKDTSMEKPERAGRPFTAGTSVPASTKILKDPKNGDFTLIDNTVEGGDPRWMQSADD